MTAPAARRMSRVDTAWLRMDNDVNLMMIVGVWLLTPAITLDALRERIETDKLLKYERFRQKAVPTPWAPAGSRTNDFDIDRHVVPMPLHARSAARPNARRCSSAVRRTGHHAAGPAPPAVAVPPGRGLRRRQRAHRRIHHCIGDGIALISVMQSITDGGSDPPKRRARRPTTTATTTGCPTPCSSR
jgi:diacylglycerol O-acyltransferase